VILVLEFIIFLPQFDQNSINMAILYCVKGISEKDVGNKIFEGI